MYESPISAIYNNFETRFENEIFKAIQKVDIIVDKEELIKALTYDRDSYFKGYQDGIAEQNEEYQELISFILDEIWDEEEWELNWQSFPEIFCRKLVKMGYVKYNEESNSYERTN